MSDASVFDAEPLRDGLIRVRRELHGHPEIGLQLPHTQQVILRELAGLGLEITTGGQLTSVTAVLRGAHPGPAVLLRADMDALPIAEHTGLEFASRLGTMHACGHDLHMAALLGAARMLADRRDDLRGEVVFMFQPGEEGYAGGRIMIEEGVLEAASSRPAAAFALHVDCLTDSGMLVTRPGPMMASASAMELTLRGTGGHPAFPHAGVDPVPVAAELVLAVQSFAARRVPATDPAVISVTAIRSDPGAANIIPKSVELELNIRTLSRETLAIVREKLPAILGAIAEAHDCELASTFVASYPVTHNDPAETEWVLDVLETIQGAAGILRLPAPSMASEDFAYVLDEVPGTLVFLGVAPEGGSGPMHSSTAVFDDSLLPVHAATLATLAWRRLHRASGRA